MTSAQGKTAREFLDAIRHLQIEKDRISLGAGIAVGGHGEVQHGRLLQPGGELAQVVVKKVHPRGYLQRADEMSFGFLRELNVWTQLDCPYILPLQGFCLNETESIFWLVSSFMEGGTVFNYVQQQRATTTVRMRLLWETTQAIAYLHGLGIRHGDIKSDNILVDSTGNAKLCDFGVAKMTCASSGLTTSTPPLSTKIYSPPEDLNMESPVATFSSDIWALGCVMLEIFAERRPWNGAGIIYILSQIPLRRLPANVEQLPIPAEIRTLIKACWSRSPDDRPPVWHCENDVQVAYLKLRLPAPAQSTNEDFTLWRDLARSLRARFERTGNLRDIDEAIQYGRVAQIMCPHGHPDQRAISEELGGARTLREHILPAGPVTPIITTAPVPLLTPQSQRSAEDPAVLHKRAADFYLQFDRTGDRLVLDEAIAQFQRALALRPPGHPHRGSTLQELAVALHRRYNVTKGAQPGDLDSAIEYYDELLLSRPEGHPRRDFTLRELAVAYHARALRNPRPTDLSMAIDCYREAVALHPPGHSRRPFLFYELGGALHTRYRRNSDRDDLKDAIQCFREVIQLTPAGTTRYINATNALSAALRDSNN